MTDPDAWKQSVSDIVSQKNRAKLDAAQREQTRKEHLVAEYEKARDLLRGQPEEGFQEFAIYLQSQGETVGVRHAWDAVKGPSIGVDVSDKSGLIMDVVLQARVGGAHLRWVWVYEYRGNRRMPQERELQSGEDGPSKQDVIETLAEHYQKASANR